MEIDNKRQYLERYFQHSVIGTGGNSCCDQDYVSLHQLRHVASHSTQISGRKFRSICFQRTWKSSYKVFLTVKPIILIGNEYRAL